MVKQTDWSKLQALYKNFRDDTTLIKQGEEPKALYILISGRLSVEKDGIILTSITRRGDYIGEIASLLNTTSSATVKTITQATLISIETSKIDTFFNHTPEVAILLATKMAERLVELNTNFAAIEKSAYKPDRIRELSQKHLDKVSIVSQRKDALDLEKLKKFYKTYPKGYEITTQGRYPRALYILVNGTVEIIKNDKVIAIENQRGYYLGDVAILRESPSNGTAIAKEEVTLIEIQRDQISSFLTHSPDVALSIARKLAERTIAINDLYLDLQKETVQEIMETPKRNIIPPYLIETYKMLGIHPELYRNENS